MVQRYISISIRGSAFWATWAPAGWPVTREIVAPPISSAEEERILRRQVMEQTDILARRDDGFTAAIPRTELAAKWWGRGTRWCTAADQNNYFQSYDSKAPLLVMLWPDGRKVQLQITPTHIQLMDEKDQSVEKDFIAKRRELLDLLKNIAGMGMGEILVKI